MMVKLKERVCRKDEVVAAEEERREEKSHVPVHIKETTYTCFLPEDLYIETNPKQNDIIIDYDTDLTRQCMHGMHVILTTHLLPS